MTKADVEKAMTPEDLTRLFVERSNAGDADGVAALYEEDAVMAYPPVPSRWVARRSGTCGLRCSRTRRASSRSRRCRRSSAVISR